MNIGIQLFTYDQSRGATEVLKFLQWLMVVGSDLKVVWTNAQGIRKSTVANRLINQDSQLVLNEGYIQTSQRNLVPQLLESGVFEVIAHFNVSPDSVAWAHSSGVLKGVSPFNKNILSAMQSSERCAIIRKPEVIPTVLEITVKCYEPKLQLLSIFSELLCRAWSGIDCSEKFAVIDVGGDWLFFPKSGFNPNVLNVEIFNSSQAGRISKNRWQVWRERHNISIESDTIDKTVARATVHSEEFRSQAQ